MTVVRGTVNLTMEGSRCAEAPTNLNAARSMDSGDGGAADATGDERTRPPAADAIPNDITSRRLVGRLSLRGGGCPCERATTENGRSRMTTVEHNIHCAPRWLKNNYLLTTNKRAKAESRPYDTIMNIQPRDTKGFLNVI